MTETGPGIPPSSMERLGLGRTSRPHFAEIKKPTMTGEASSREKWSEDAAKKVVASLK